MRAQRRVASLGPMNRLLSRGALGAGIAATAVMLAAFALTGCTGDPGPIVTETPSASASVMPSTSASPSVSPSAAPLTDEELLALMPPEAAFPDVRGAIATAEFFVEQFPIVYETGDLRVWDALSMPECTFCESVRSHVLEEITVGDHEVGGAISIDTDSVVANYYDVDGYWYVTFSYSQTPSSTMHADGTSEISGDGGTGSTSLRMTPQGSIWKVSDVGVEPD